MDKVNKILKGLLQTLLDCGYADINFLLGQMDVFDIEVREVAEQIDENSEFFGGKFDVNLLIFIVYDSAVKKAISENFHDGKYFAEDFDINEFIEISTNYLASSLSVKDLDDNWEQVFDKEELIKALSEIITE